jgi:PAS domain S-box-containing protein
VYDVKHTITTKSGKCRYLSINGTPLFDEKGEFDGMIAVLVESARDITERKALEEELEKDRYRLTAILEGTNVGTWEWNIQTGETHFNERWAQIIGYTLDELDPISIETWKQYTHPDDFKESERLLDKHFRGELDHYEAECRMRQKNGTWVWVLDRGKVATWTEDGEPEWMYGTHQDITERREAEQLREDINRIIQHDLKNPLNGIMGMIQLLREDESLSEEGREYVAFIEESGKQMRLLIDTSLSLYKMEQGTYTFDPEEVALDDLFDLITQEFKQATERKDLDIRFDYDSKHSPTSQKYIVRGKYFLCYSLFSNLIKNAIEASRNNDIIRISIREDKPSWITTAIWNRQEIPREIRKRFGHKYATAGKKRGTGLGVYSAVLMTEIQGGRFNWRSSQEEGTEITVTLPRAQ